VAHGVDMDGFRFIEVDKRRQIRKYLCRGTRKRWNTEKYGWAWELFILLSFLPRVLSVSVFVSLCPTVCVIA